MSPRLEYIEKQSVDPTVNLTKQSTLFGSALNALGVDLPPGAGLACNHCWNTHLRTSRLRAGAVSGTLPEVLGAHKALVAEAYPVARPVAVRAIMEHASCNVIYVDRAVSHDRSLRGSASALCEQLATLEAAHLAQNVGLLLNVFGEGTLTPAI